MADEPVTIIDRDVLKALSADTRMDILKALAEGRRMPSWVARRLGKSDATIVEHLKALERAGLVKRTSAPGKKWVFYSLTDRGEGIIGGKGRKLVIVIALSILVVFAGASMFAHYATPGQFGSDSLRRFSSYSELKAFIDSSSESYGAYGLARSSGLDTTATTMYTPSQAAEAGKASDYSQTNVQVAGVDEADIVKSDGRYLYVAPSYGSTVQIIEAYPAETARIVSNITVNGTIGGLYISGDRLVIISSIYSYVRPMLDIIAPSYMGSTSTIIGTYDVSDRAQPTLLKESSAEGSYYDSRMVDGYVYAIAQESVYSGGPIALPTVATGGVERTIAASEVYYSPYQDSSYVFTTVIAENIADASAAANTKTFLLGYSQSMYVSPDNIYLVSEKRMDYKAVFERVVDDAILPSVPADVQARIIEIRDSDANVYEKGNEVQQALQDYYATLSPEDGAVAAKALEERYQAVYAELAKEYERTVVHRIAIDSGSITYAASGEAPGVVLNQFSMDETGGYFRIATTSGQWAGTGSTTNNMYVLDPALNVVGRLEGIAPGERIYSVRFMGGRAYMVTFRQVDPLFVIDLSDPAAPSVLGYLKVQGVSDYLHPYDDTHVIGVGREADAEGRVTGVKLSLFDATDVVNPVELSKYVVEGGWSWSEASYDHHAFLFSRDKQLLVIPVQTTNNNGTDYTSWQGVYVFSLSLQDGFALKGKITHANETAAAESKYYYGYDTQIRRSLYIDSVLYTVSGSFVKANDLATLAEVGKVELPATEPVYRIMGGIASGAAV
jgi:uncharacterized secreted protein with C-terminal beta-propeller domain/DNA-binding HxlR family transcriptional regulator